MKSNMCLLVLSGFWLLGCSAELVEEGPDSSSEAVRRDRSAPTVSITAPANGASVSGTVNIQGTASDNVAVSAVDVRIDTGAYVLASGTTNWSFPWSTSAESNGAHTITARARDTSGRTRTAAITVNVDNALAASGQLTISSALTLDKTGIIVPDTIHGSVTYQNTGSSPVTFQTMVIAGRPPGGAHAGGPYLDFTPVLGSTTLAPGAMVTLAASRSFTSSDPTGQWESYPTYQDSAGAWHDGSSVFFEVNAPTSTGACAPQTSWRPSAGFMPLSDAEAIARICPTAEKRPLNANANAYVPSASELSSFRGALDQYGRTSVEGNPYTAYVTGGCGGLGHTTDEIIQCTAAKWGIPVDWFRAQYVQESWWRHIDPNTGFASLGDKRFVGTTEALKYPAFSREKDASGNLTGYVWESVGLTQVKWRPDGSNGTGTEPLRWQSTAFNADYQAANVRFYYDDPQSQRTLWGDSTYVAGEDWWSLGGWFSPYPWHNSGQSSYISSVQNHLANRTWEKTIF